MFKSIAFVVAVVISSSCSAFVAYTDIPFDFIPGVDPNLLSLDVYAPDNADGTNPTMVFFHGGSFISGDKAQPGLLTPKVEYFTDRGWVFVSANYRLTDVNLPANHPDQVSHPDHISDVASAIGWVNQNIGNYGGQSDHLVTMGFSAGAQLVALAGTDETRLQAEGLSLDDVDGVVALDGLYDIPLRYQQPPPFPMPEMLLVWGTDLATQNNMSPVFHVDAGTDISPMLIVHASAPNPTEQSENFRDALVAAGHTANTYDAVGLSHSQIGMSVGVWGNPLAIRVDQHLASLSNLDGDFNGDGNLNCLDVDALALELLSIHDSPVYDLNGDNTVDIDDLTEWLSVAGANNLASGNAYQPGDGNLDGVVDGMDFILWNQNKFTPAAAFCSGDFNVDGVVDGQDFVVWNANKFTSSDGLSAVPEPTSLLLLLAAILLPWERR